MSGTSKTKGLSAQIAPELHQAVRERREALGKTTDEYVTMVLRADVDPNIVTITLAPELCGEVESELQRTERTLDEFVALALQHELNKEENDMSEPTRTLAFAVPVSLFFRVKDRLQELDNKSQKDYVIGLITADLDEADRQRKARLQAEAPPSEEQPGLADDGERSGGDGDGDGAGEGN